jgi:hypothetical protein
MTIPTIFFFPFFFLGTLSTFFPVFVEYDEQIIGTKRFGLKRPRSFEK